MHVSVIIPVYNEEQVIVDCLTSLAKQTVAKSMDITIVDDGSTDHTLIKVQATGYQLQILRQDHKGPGAARNLGAANAKGDILVFVDADMEFEPDFIEKLIAPIVAGKTIGTFSKEEYLLNKDQPYARYWNLNLGREAERMEPRDYSHNQKGAYGKLKQLWEDIEGQRANISRSENTAHVFRAILRTQFELAGGFDTTIGYTDDWSLSRKLNTLAIAAPGAKFYHRNPETLAEVWQQARWFGKNEFLTKNFVRRFYNLCRYCPLLAIFNIYDPQFFVFKLVYNSAVFTSVFLAFFHEAKFK